MLPMNIVNYKKFLLGLSVLMLVPSYKVNAQEKTNRLKNLVQYVDPMIGTAKMGHTYPGATVPFWECAVKPRN